MSVFATATVPTEAFTVGERLATDGEVRLERVTESGSRVVRYLWVTDDGFESVGAELPGPVTAEVVDTVGENAVVRAASPADRVGFFDAVTVTDVEISAGVPDEEGWTVRFRIEDREELVAFVRACAERDVSLDLERVYEPSVPPSVGSELGLTDTQRETLLLALDAGYFDVPRETNVTELADRLGVSDTAVSQRLRRGLSSVLTATLPDGPDA